MKEIPFVAHEAMMDRLERTIRRLWILCILLVFLLVASNALWIYYESQFEEVVTTTDLMQKVDTTDGGNAIVNGTGRLVVNGENNTENENND